MSRKLTRAELDPGDASLAPDFGEAGPLGDSLANELGAAFGTSVDGANGVLDDGDDALDPAFAHSDGAPSVPATPQRTPRRRNPSTPAQPDVDDHAHAAAFEATTASLSNALAPTDAFLDRLRSVVYEDEAEIAAFVRAARDVVRRRERLLADPSVAAPADDEDADEAQFDPDAIAAGLGSVHTSTASLIAALSSLHDQAQMQHSGHADVGRRLRSLKQALVTAQRDHDAVELDRSRLREFHGGGRRRGDEAREHCARAAVMLDTASERAKALLATV